MKVLTTRYVDYLDLNRVMISNRDIAVFPIFLRICLISSNPKW